MIKIGDLISISISKKTKCYIDFVVRITFILMKISASQETIINQALYAWRIFALKKNLKCFSGDHVFFKLIKYKFILLQPQGSLIQ